MPDLANLTDYDPQSVIPDNDGIRRVYIDGSTKPTIEPKSRGVIETITNKLLGLNGEERYQLWPEKVVREGLSAAGDVMSGATPQWAVDPATGDVHTSPQMIEGAQAMSALAGTGGLAGAEEGAVLNATPSLRPALKHNGKLYKGKPGQEHQDVIPNHLYDDFQQKAMSGEDISHYNFGFVNDKGHFLNREDALKYGIDSGIIDPHAGKYGALTSTLMADSSKPGTAIEAMAKAEPFYSALEHNVKNINQNKMNGEAWLGTLSNKPGVKPEELDWTGLKSFLEENKGKPVTKEQIEQHLTANKVELKEVSKGVNSRPELTEKDKGELAALEKRFVDKDMSLNMDDAERVAELRMMRDRLPTLSDAPTKYHSYQLPGGENYREMLLTLPKKGEARANELYNKIQKGQASRDEFKEYANFAHDTKNQYKSSHWDEPNILAHVRMNDRTIDGKKSLHLEEIQSDWHQQGRDKGYKGEAATKEYDKLIEKKYELANKVNEIDSKLRAEIGKGYDTRNLSEADRQLLTSKLHEARVANPAYQEANKAYTEVADKVERGNPHMGVPDAPFKKSWHELALKRMIREAAEKGYDRLSWTPGKEHNRRYPGRPDKEEKGMEYFYDTMLPKTLEKIGKEHGVKVKQGKLPMDNEKLGYAEILHRVNMTTDEWKALTPAQRADKLNDLKIGSPVHYIDLPQSLKDTAMRKGFPLFSSTHIFTPVAGNPFENKK